MAISLERQERLRVLPLIENVKHELTVECVINGTSPGAVYVDCADEPRSCFIKTPECNVLAGDAHNAEFNNGIKEYIGYYDQLTCDGDDWAKVVPDLHPNVALLEYYRESYCLHCSKRLDYPSSSGTLEYVYPSMLGKIAYTNKDMLLDWINIVSVEEYGGLCLAAIIVIDEAIAACSAVDCVLGTRIEIGVKTAREYRRKGYGITAVSALINESLKNGISEIGWHCVEANVGSNAIARRCGFTEVRKYTSYSPYPPIENNDDLSTDEWTKHGIFYEAMAKKDNTQYWQAARCWGKAKNMQRAIQCIRLLIQNGKYWILDYIDGSDDFIDFSSEKEWATAIEAIRKEIRACQ